MEQIKLVNCLNNRDYQVLEEHFRWYNRSQLQFIEQLEEEIRSDPHFKSTLRKYLRKQGEIKLFRKTYRTKRWFGWDSYDYHDETYIVILNEQDEYEERKIKDRYSKTYTAN